MADVLQNEIQTVAGAALSFIESIQPLITTEGAVGQVITALETFLPVVAQEAADLVPVIRNIISAVTSSGAATPDQVAALQALDQQADAAYDAAAAAYQAAHPAPTGDA